MDEKELMAQLAGLEEPAVLATIVSAKGSTPRKTGARMLIGREGAPPTTVRVDLTDDFTTWSPAVCGGIMNVFIERANPERFGGG